MAKGNDNRAVASTKGNRNAIPRSITLAKRGFGTSADFIATAGAATADVLAGEIEVDRARAAVGFMGRMLQMMDMEHRIGASKTPRRIIGVTARRIEDGAETR